jgi:hypothetical protein
LGTPIPRYQLFESTERHVVVDAHDGVDGGGREMPRVEELVDRQPALFPTEAARKHQAVVPGDLVVVESAMIGATPRLRLGALLGSGDERDAAAVVLLDQVGDHAVDAGFVVDVNARYPWQIDAHGDERQVLETSEPLAESIDSTVVAEASRQHDEAIEPRGEQQVVDEVAHHRLRGGAGQPASGDDQGSNARGMRCAQHAADDVGVIVRLEVVEQDGDSKCFGWHASGPAKPSIIVQTPRRVNQTSLNGRSA